jgi:hypothetical protein
LGVPPPINWFARCQMSMGVGTPWGSLGSVSRLAITAALGGDVGGAGRGEPGAVAPWLALTLDPGSWQGRRGRGAPPPSKRPGEGR